MERTVRLGISQVLSNSEILGCYDATNSKIKSSSEMDRNEEQLTRKMTGAQNSRWMARQEETGQREGCWSSFKDWNKGDKSHALTHWFTTMSVLQNHLLWFEKYKQIVLFLSLENYSVVLGGDWKSVFLKISIGGLNEHWWLKAIVLSRMFVL